VSEVGSSFVSPIPEAKLPVNTFSCIIGMRLSQAHNYLRNSAVALQLIDSMANMIIIDIDSLGRPVANMAAQSSPDLPSPGEALVSPEPLRRSATMVLFEQRWTTGGCGRMAAKCKIVARIELVVYAAIASHDLDFTFHPAFPSPPLYPLLTKRIYVVL